MNAHLISRNEVTKAAFSLLSMISEKLDCLG